MRGAMRSTPVLTNRVGELTVSTVLIDLWSDVRAGAPTEAVMHGAPYSSCAEREPFAYYEVAIIRRGQPIKLVDTNIADADEAAELHRATVQKLGSEMSVGARVVSPRSHAAGSVIDIQRHRDGTVASVLVRWDGMNHRPVWYLVVAGALVFPGGEIVHEDDE